MRYADLLNEAAKEYQEWESKPRTLVLNKPGPGRKLFFKILPPLNAPCACGRKRQRNHSKCSRCKIKAREVTQKPCRCGRPGYARGKCQSCYESWLRRFPRKCPTCPSGRVGGRYTHCRRCLRKNHKKGYIYPERTCYCGRVHRNGGVRCQSCLTKARNERVKCLCGKKRHGSHSRCHACLKAHRRADSSIDRCSNGCKDAVHAKGLCYNCYQREMYRKRRYGENGQLQRRKRQRSVSPTNLELLFGGQTGK